MRDYELVVVCNPKLGDKDQAAFLSKLASLPEELKGKLKKKENLGKKLLAYPIKKCTEGIYFQLNFLLPGEKLKDFDAKIKHEDKILRYLLIKEEG